MVCVKIELLDLLQRFWSKVDCGTDDECWEWIACKDSNGYGQFRLNDKRVSPHRLAYELECGSIPNGYDIHHKCNNPACANPYHLMAVTTREHIVNLSPNSLQYKESRRTHCIRGHEYTEENTYIYNGSRNCRICVLNRNRRRYYRHRESYLTKGREYYQKYRRVILIKAKQRYYKTF